MVDDLSETLKLSTERISIWFQNRRARFKKARKLEVNQEKQLSNHKLTYGYSPLLKEMMSTNDYISTNNSALNLPWLKNEEKLALNNTYLRELNNTSVSTTINTPINYMGSFKSNQLCLNHQELRTKYSSYFPTLINPTENQM
jgi:hypothetical protein